MQKVALPRLLPAQPSLEHLRKEAKQELVQLRARASSVQLADAQHLVARSYGFTTWQSLRLEVDRRRAERGLRPPIVLGEGFPRPRRPTGFRAAVFSPVNAELTFFGALAIPVILVQGPPCLAMITSILFG